MFSIFMLFTIFGQLVQQIMPHFVTQRALYEARERPSKTYSWKAFMISNIVVELPWNTLMAIFIFFCWYYPIGLYRNAEDTNAVTERGGLMFLLIWEFLLFTSTFTSMVISAVETAETGGNIANLMFSLTLVFCGVLASPSVFPHFWIFMYRVSPFTYLVDAMLSVGVANTAVVCAANELRHFNPPSGQTCGQYMAAYINSGFGGYLTDSSATTNCSYCSYESTNQFLAQVNSSYSHRWRNFGILWVFIIFNAVMAVVLYWLVRVPKKSGGKAKKA
jgi:ATP-binding cassette subfamily G (WHITE) protein 2 (PDR)